MPKKKLALSKGDKACVTKLTEYLDANQLADLDRQDSARAAISCYDLARICDAEELNPAVISTLIQHYRSSGRTVIDLADPGRVRVLLIGNTIRLQKEKK